MSRRPRLGTIALALLAITVIGAAIVVYNDPNRTGGDFIFIPAVFAIAWLAGFALRARVSVPAGIPVARPELSASAEPALTDVYWPGYGRTGTDVYRGAPEHMITGPALVELAHTTVAVPYGATLTTGPLGELRLEGF